MNGTVNNPIGCFNLVIETFIKSSLTLRQSSIIISIVPMLISVGVAVEHCKDSVVFALPQKVEHVLSL